MSLSYEYESLRAEIKNFVLHVQLNRPEKMNAIDKQMSSELRHCFNQASDDPDVRVIVISGGKCKLFCSGIDLQLLMTLAPMPEADVGRRGRFLYKFVRELQKSLSAIDDCNKPVITAIHGKAIGIGTELVAACDIRLCTEDVCFSVREAKMGLAPDVGALTRLPKACGNNSLVREACFTAKDFGAQEAMHMGLVSRVLPNKDACLEAAMTMAAEIAALTPIATTITKRTLNYCRDHSVEDGLEYVCVQNQCMLQSGDVMEAVKATMEKRVPTFAKL